MFWFVDKMGCSTSRLSNQGGAQTPTKPFFFCSVVCYLGCAGSAATVRSRETSLIVNRALSDPQNEDSWTTVTFKFLKIRPREPVLRILFGSIFESFGQKIRSFKPPTVKTGKRPYFQILRTIIPLLTQTHWPREAVDADGVGDESEAAEHRHGHALHPKRERLCKLDTFRILWR